MVPKRTLVHPPEVLHAHSHTSHTSHSDDSSYIMVNSWVSDLLHDSSQQHYVERLNLLQLDAQAQFRSSVTVSCGVPLRWYIPAGIRFADAAMEQRFGVWNEASRQPIARGVSIAFLVMMLVYCVNYAVDAQCLPTSDLVLLAVAMMACVANSVMFLCNTQWRWKYELAALSVLLAALCMSMLLFAEAFCVPVTQAYSVSLGVGMNMAALLHFGGLMLQPLEAIGLSTILIATCDTMLAAHGYPFQVSLVLVPVFAVLMMFYARYMHQSRRFQFFLWTTVAHHVTVVDQSKIALLESQHDALVQRAATAKAEAAKQMQKAILGYTCHELRNPLHGLRGCLDELAASCSLGHGVNQNDIANLDSMESTAVKLSRVVDDVLDFNKLQAGKLEVVKHTFNIRNLIDNTVKLVRSTASTSVPVTCTVDDAVPDLLISDELRVSQILSNALTNAVKLSAASSPVDLKCSVAAADNTLLLQVSHDGPSPLLAAQSVGSFDLAADEDSMINGTGLGLSIARMIVHLLDGQAGYESRGARSVFWFRLPVTPVQDTPQHIFGDDQTAIQAVNASPQSMSCWSFWGKLRVGTSPLTVAIVDDESLNRRLMSSMLRRLGHLVVEFTDGDEIVPAVTLGQRVDLCFMDIHMVRMDGRDATKQLRAAGYTFPVIAATANASAMDIQSYQAIGFDGVLHKPFAVHDVQRLLQACFSTDNPQ